jgi:succinate dehydrogenase / fumarate reductase cytochrome b subunit
MKPLVSAVVRKYSWQFSGMIAHLIQRVSGVLLLIYLILHVHTIGELSQGPVAFNNALAQFNNPFFRLMEIALLGTVILHALNGIRITLVDLGVGHQRQRQSFWIWSIGIGVLLFLAGGIPIFLAAVLKQI